MSVMPVLFSFLPIVYCYHHLHCVPSMHHLPCCADTRCNGPGSGVGGESERHVWSEKQRAEDSVCNRSAIKQESVRLRAALLLSSLKAFELCILGFSRLVCYVIFISLRHQRACFFVSSAWVNLAASLVCPVRLCNIYFVMSSLSSLIAAELLPPVPQADVWTASPHWISFYVLFYTQRGLVFPPR